jgi:hypothetical protein
MFKQVRSFLLSYYKFYSIAVLFVLLGCYQLTGLPKKNDMLEIVEGKKTIVIMRTIWELDGKLAEPFPAQDITRDIIIEIERDITAVKAKDMVSNPRLILSEETRKQGWTYFILEPGTYFLSATTRLNAFTINKQQPVWRFENPGGVKSVYIGTLNLVCGGVHIKSGVKVKRPQTKCEGNIFDETGLAVKIINDLIPSLSPPDSSIMKTQVTQ